MWPYKWIVQVCLGVCACACAGVREGIGTLGAGVMGVWGSLLVVWYRDLNSGPHKCAASTLNHWAVSVAPRTTMKLAVLLSCWYLIWVTGYFLHSHSAHVYFCWTLHDCQLIVRYFAPSSLFLAKFVKLETVLKSYGAGEGLHWSAVALLLVGPGCLMMCTHLRKGAMVSDTATMSHPTSTYLWRGEKREKTFKLYGRSILSHHGALDRVAFYHFPHSWWNHFNAPCLFIMNRIIHNYWIIFTLKSSPITATKFLRKLYGS